MMTEQYRKRVKGILNTLEVLTHTGTRPVEEIRMAPGSYRLEQEFQMDPGDWKLFERGDTWGGRDSHFWFYVPVVIPGEYHRQCVVISLNTGATDIWNTDNPQVLVYVNGKLTATMDMNHTEMILADQAQAGEVFETAFYAYSNSAGKTNFFDVSIGVLQPGVERLYYDIKVLWDAADLMPDGDLERVRLFELLNKCVSHLDLRQPGSEEFLRSVEEAGRYLREQYYDAERPVSPVTVHGVGHTHIDVAWKWPLRQTRQKVVRSFLTVLNLMEKYPEYRFMSSQPQLYEFVKEEAPEVYERVKERIREGRWETEGAMWLEADCNLISGESMIRQILHGKKFFREEFGTGDDEVMWLPDVFGYSVAMPQILKQSGIKYFMTTKIGWNEYNQIPNDTMMWRGLDGSQVLSYFITTSDYHTYPELMKKRSFSTTYNGLLTPGQVMGTWQRYQNKDLSHDVLTCYGYGDGGGGPTSCMLELGRRLERGVGPYPVVKQTSVREFFHLLEKNLEGKKVPKWSGELYLESHRGTYTSMARNKKSNRVCEFKTVDAEFLQVLAMTMDRDRMYPKKELERAWKLILLNQFHDILPGSSCWDVYEDSKEQYEEVMSLDDALIRDAVSAILGQMSSGKKVEDANKESRAMQIALINQLGFSRTSLVTIPKEEMENANLVDGAHGIDAQGRIQRAWDGSGLYLAHDMAAKSVNVRELNVRGLSAPETGAPDVKIREAGVQEVLIPVIETFEEQDGKLHRIQTNFYEITFNENGEFASLYDREEHREVLMSGRPGNRLTAFEDRPAEYDAWNIDAFYEEKQWDITELSECRLLENHSLRACIYIRREFLNSVIEQEIYLYGHTKRIDFKTRADWREHQILLKAAFPVDVLTDKAVYEVQFGNVERPTHRNTSWDEARFEVCVHKWADVAECGYGVALLNDCKYGMDIRESVMRLTLIKSGIFPNPDADNEFHEFTYSLYPHSGDYRQGRVIMEAYDLNCPMYGYITEGLRAESYAYLSVDAENIFADTVKQAEDEEGVIIRLYEAYGKRTNTVLRLPFATGKTVEECDCLERPAGDIPVDGCAISSGQGASAWKLNFRPYEIKTLRVRP